MIIIVMNLPQIMYNPYNNQILTMTYHDSFSFVTVPLYGVLQGIAGEISNIRCYFCNVSTGNRRHLQ